MKAGSFGEKKLLPNPSVVFTDLEDGSAVLLDLDSKFYYSLNETGCLMWKVFEKNGSSDTGKLIEALMSEYDVEEAQAVGDVEEFLGSLAKEGLVQLS